MATDKKVQILLSTYNGEKYLREQIDSYLAMEHFEDCCVLIRDDGSTDRTRDILQEYERHPEFRIVYGENIGINESYLWLLAHSDNDCKYFAFSDQDDVWMSDKITKALQLLEREDPQVPLLFASRSRITDAQLKPIGYSKEPVRGISFYNAMVQNVLPGHTQVINRSMKEVLLCQGMGNVHVIDWWYYLAAATVGKIAFCEDCTVLHRQHNDNAVGYTTTFLCDIKRRVRYIMNGRGNAFAVQLWAFRERYQTMLSSEYLAELDAFLDACKGSFMERFRYALHCRAYRQGYKETLAFRLLFVLGKYAC